MRRSTTNYEEESLESTTPKLLQNSYPPSFAYIQKKTAKTKGPSATPLFYFNMPFVSDVLNNKIQHTLQKHDIPTTLVNKQGLTVERFVTSDKGNHKSQCTGMKECPEPDICHQSSMVYRASCSLCHNTYIGPTIRQLHGRVHEHMRTAKKKDDTSALGEHYSNQHPPARPDNLFRDLDRCQDALHLHIKEAMAIQKLRPTLNRRDEDIDSEFLV